MNIKLLLMDTETFTSPKAKANRIDRQPLFKASQGTYRCLFILFSITLLFGFDSQAQVMWSNPSSWTAFGATKPVEGSSVTIPSDVQMILDESTPNLANLTIMGKLEFADMDLNLTAGYIMVHGTLQVGTDIVPYTKKAVITLNATDMTESVMGMGTRGIMVMAGKLELHGVPPLKHFTKLSDHSASGSTSLSLLDNVNWSVGDQVVVAPTDFYGAGGGSAQRTEITAINGNSMNIQNGLNAQRWGKLQYLTATGMSLTPGTLPANIVDGTPTVLDERAEVVNLTRNIVVQSPDDALWQNSGFGCHIMIMRMSGMIGEAHLNGVEISRGGQSGKLGRYPFHWHMLSYSGTQTLPDATGQYIKNSTVNQSSNRGIVIHGTNGTEVRNNVVYEVRGHGVFTEDASERRNVIDGNIVMNIKNSLPGKVLKQHESGNSGGASGFWISNPDNTMTNNRAIDCEGVGLWLAFPEKAFGASSQIPIIPNRIQFGIFNNNHAHSNRNEGIMLDVPEINEEGQTSPRVYTSTSDMKEPSFPYPYLLTYDLNDYTVWKNTRNGIWNRSTGPQNRRVVSADNTERFFSGSIDNKNNFILPIIEKSLVVGTSLNYNMNGVTRPTTWGSGPLSAFASYHSNVDLLNNVVVNFPAELGQPSGFMALNDYYLIPVDKGNVRNIGNILINTHPGVRTKPLPLTQHVYGVLWDKHNYANVEASDENYYVYDEPFFTHGQTPQIVAPSTAVSGGVIVRGPFYGIYNYYLNGIERAYEEINVVRTTAAGDFVGNWQVDAGAPGDILGNFRHFAAHPSGYYYLDFPTIDNINDFNISTSNLLTSNDYQVISVEYSGNYNITQLFASTAYNMSEFGNKVPYPIGGINVRTYTALANFQEVINATMGEVYWQDKVNNKVWFKIRGGVNPGYPDLAANHDWNLSKSFRIRAYGSLSTNDTQAPTVPTSLASGNVSSTSFILNWSASTDDTGVSEYQVFKDNVLLGTTASTSFKVNGISASTTYSFTVRAKDAANNLSAQSTALSVTAAEVGSPVGNVTLETWSKIAGSTVASIPTGTTPTATEILTSLETFSNVADNYGVRIRGYIVPTITGSYTFYIACDDQGQLSLSTDNQPANLITAIATVNDWTGSRQWTKSASQQSTAEILNAGQKYYFEVLMKESLGGDNLAIGWSGPGITNIEVIGSANIERYVEVIVMPVNIVSFSGSATSTGTVLNWRTAAEQNNSGFEILRSRNGVDFEKIGFKKSLATNGNSGTPLDYSFNDVTNDADVYYKLNQVDINGKAVASPTIIVRAKFVTENQVYPNPATNNFSVSTADSNAKIIVTTLEGRIIKTITATGKVTTIDSGNWPSGMYIIQVQSASGTTVKKLVISK